MRTDDSNAWGDRVAAGLDHLFQRVHVLSGQNAVVVLSCRAPTYARIASVSIARSGAPACLLGEIPWERGRGRENFPERGNPDDSQARAEFLGKRAFGNCRRLGGAQIEIRYGDKPKILFEQSFHDI